MNRMRFVLLLIAMVLALTACGYSIVEEMPVQVGSPASNTVQLP